MSAVRLLSIRVLLAYLLTQTQCRRQHISVRITSSTLCNTNQQNNVMRFVAGQIKRRTLVSELGVRAKSKKYEILRV